MHKAGKSTFLFLILLANLLNAQHFNLKFMGKATFETGYTFQGIEMGGLSGLDYDEANDIYYCISDDYGHIAPARFYTLKIDLSDGTLNDGDITFTSVTTLLDTTGQPFEYGTIDPEGIAFTKSCALYVSSEGGTNTQFKPFIRRFALDGSYLDNLVIPEKFTPTPSRNYGVHRNLAFESLTLSPDERFLFTAIENALAQDGPLADLNVSTPVRILKYNLSGKSLAGEFLFWVDPVEAPPKPADGFRVNGLVELIAVNENFLLAMEREYSEGVGNGIKLYEISLTDSDDIQNIGRLDKTELNKIKAAKKTLLYNFSEIGIKLDNLEGMTFGPKLPDGRQSLILVSDNNFNAAQFTQVLAFTISERVVESKFSNVRIHSIQGAGHKSPFLDEFVENVSGIVTAVTNQKNKQGFWFQDFEADGDIATSEGLFVSIAPDSPGVKIGDAVIVSGEVEERGHQGELTITQLTNPKITVQSHGNAVPKATVIGVGGRMQPKEIIDDDSLKLFDPKNDGIDFYESLEGMLVQINNPVAVGPLSRYREFVVLADDGKNGSIRTGRGGILLRPNDFNPERIMVQSLLISRPAGVSVSDRFSGSVVGVIDYSFGNFKLVNAEELPDIQPGNLIGEKTSLLGENDWVTVASYNVENLDFEDRDEKFFRVAETIVKNLSAPDILALQEVQDNNGPVDDGVVDATKTFEKLIQTIATAGGPKYEFRQIDPINNADGGQPGGNIRVGFLFNPERVRFIDRGHGGPHDMTKVEFASNGPHLSLSPGRIDPNSVSFAGDEEKNFEGGRKSLAAECEFNGHKIFLINNHLKSKRGDDRLFGSNQPPKFHTEIQRKEQAKVIRNFLHNLLSSDPNANVIVLGDMNEHEFRAPMELLAGHALTNLIEMVPLDERYTYIFNGNSQVLDHILVSQNLMRNGSPEVDIVHVNAEFSHDQRASDHDPVLARFKLPLVKPEMR